MLIWINGAFGAGKTQTACELHRRLGRGQIADPELIGFAIHRMLPATARGDFQDLPQWRAAVIATLIQADAAGSGPLIVPMTVVRNDYFEEIMDGLRSQDVEVKHYSLIASPETLHRRLAFRSAYLIGRLLGRDETWAIQQIERCVAALSDDRYATHIDTDGRSVDAVVEEIAAHSGLRLCCPRLSPARYQARRLSVGIRHIRI